MIALALAALLAAPPQATDSVVRSVLTDVCLPYVSGERAEDAAMALGFVTIRSEGGEVEMATEDEAFLLRLDTSGAREEGDLGRLCVLQARRGSLGDLRTGVAAPMREMGFTAEAGQPANLPVWSKDGTSVSLRQNEGRAAIMRVTWSMLDEGA